MTKIEFNGARKVSKEKSEMKEVKPKMINVSREEKKMNKYKNYSY